MVLLEKNQTKKIELQNKGLWDGNFINNYRNVWINQEHRQYSI